MDQLIGLSKKNTGEPHDLHWKILLVSVKMFPPTNPLKMWVNKECLWFMGISMEYPWGIYGISMEYLRMMVYLREISPKYMAELFRLVN